MLVLDRILSSQRFPIASRAITLVGCLVVASPTFAQSSTPDPQAVDVQPQAVETQPQALETQPQTLETQPQAPQAVEVGSPDVAELGVTVVDSPGVGVLVKGVVAGSPADAAGIVAGDFIVAFGDSQVVDPNDLTTSIQASAIGSTVSIGVWRDGTEESRNVVLAAWRSLNSRGGRGWLGVSLDSLATDGARILSVSPGSPADQAGLRAGDNITAVGEIAIGNAADLMNVIAQQKPGSIVAITVIQDGNEVSPEVKLGTVPGGPQFSFRFPWSDMDAYRMPGDLVPIVPPAMPLDIVPDPYSPWKEDFEKLKREVEVMRQQLRQAGGSLEAEDSNDSATGDQAIE